jgi:hypothetical protein
MSNLQDLADARDEILRAELAALLHNLGKLDVNFLKEAASGSASADIQQHHSTISNYIFKRFVYPDLNMFMPEISGVAGISGTDDRQVFRQRVADLDLWPKSEEQNLQILLSDFDTQKQHYPLLAEELDSLRELCRFLQGNGPLYFCQTTQRAQAQERLQQIEQEITDLNNKLRQPDTPDKPALGQELQRLKTQSTSEQQSTQSTLDSIEHQEQHNLENLLRSITLELGGEVWSIGDLLTLFWDDFFYKPGGDDYQRISTLARWLKPDHTTRIPALLALSHGEVSGSEKGDGGTPGAWDHLILTTAFGFEHRRLALWNMAQHRREIVDAALQRARNLYTERSHFTKVAEQYLKEALSDTQWPWNEITLWNYASSIAALFKSCAASIVLNQAVPSVAETRWRLLHISFDGLAFWSQSYHVTDMLMRREALKKGLDAVRHLLEVEYPLGNEIYRDEHGSVFIVADYDQLLTLKDSNGTSLEHLLRNKFDGAGISGELVPEIKVSAPYQGKQIKLADVLTNRYGTRNLDAQQAMTWWTEQRPDNAPICTVCGVRPIGYPTQASQAENPLGLHSWATQKKAEQRNVCRVCLDRRGRRAKDWAHNEDKAFERTIWIDEIADNNSRFALVVGHFVLDGWLDGRLIPTLLKSPSFARIQRCWETTRTFWEEVQRRLISDTLQQHQHTRWRLGIKPGNAAALSKEIGAYHTCELDVQGQRMGVCWDEDKELFWTTANLQYLSEQLGIERAIWHNQQQLIDTLKCDILKGTLPIYEPGGYLGQERRVPLAAEDCQVSDDCQFLPFIPLVTEPALFMALVPADVALDVVQAIKKKYDAEMARVRDRLPMHLGIAFAPRRTPMQTVFDAGRKMLKLPTPWEKWDVQKHTDRHVRFSHEDRPFEWCYPQHMGDGITEDKWYPHLLITDPTRESDLTHQTHFEHVDKIQSGQTVYIRPSRFDFEFLDTPGRRFAIAYDEKGRRMSRPTRPFLLDDVDRLNKIWQYMRHLKRAQRHQVIYAIEATRELWCHNDTTCASWTDQTFTQFVKDTLAGAEWWQYPHHNVPHGQKQKKISWSQIGDDTTRALLIEAGVRGELADLAELHHQILKEDE